MKCLVNRWLLLVGFLLLLQGCASIEKRMLEVDKSWRKTSIFELQMQGVKPIDERLAIRPISIQDAVGDMVILPRSLTYEPLLIGFTPEDAKNFDISLLNTVKANRLFREVFSINSLSDVQGYQPYVLGIALLKYRLMYTNYDHAVVTQVAYAITDSKGTPHYSNRFFACAKSGFLGFSTIGGVKDKVNKAIVYKILEDSVAFMKEKSPSVLSNSEYEGVKFFDSINKVLKFLPKSMNSTSHFGTTIFTINWPEAIGESSESFDWGKLP